MALGAGNRQPLACRQRRDQPVNALVRRQAADEQDAVTVLVLTGTVAPRVGTAVDDAAAGGWRPQLAGRVGGDEQKPVEETRQQTGPVAALEAVVGDRGAASERASGKRGYAARRAAHMMGVHQVGPRKGGRQTRRDRPGRVPAEVGERTKLAAA